jgi:hypothetical protein
MKLFLRICLVVLTLVVVVCGLLFILAQKTVPEQIIYGMSFNTMYATELQLDWKQTYDAIIDELGVRHFRLAAHWPMIEPERGVYNFSELDYQIQRAEEVGATVVLAVGRRLPRWPECHVPEWAKSLPLEEQQTVLLETMTQVVERYKNSPAVMWWQVENEPFLSVFAFEHCGELDVEFLERQIAHVKSLDGTRPVLVTDSGNLGTWHGAYTRGDIFGTSVYVHLWNPELGPLRTIVPAWFYRVKDNVMALLFGEKPTVLIELSAEPWLLEPIVQAPLEVQFARMNTEKLEEIISYAERTRFERQYLWGAEWWYWLHLQGRSEMWERGQALYVKETPE